jgi:hypothetical protein
LTAFLGEGLFTSHPVVGGGCGKDGKDAEAIQKWCNRNREPQKRQSPEKSGLCRIKMAEAMSFILMFIDVY